MGVREGVRDGSEGREEGWEGGKEVRKGVGYSDVPTSKGTSLRLS